MNMPSFTAEHTLYRTSSNYRTGIHLPTSPMRVVYPAREVIQVHSCPPGWSDIGGSCWPNTLTEPTGGGGGEPSGVGEIGVGGGPSGGGETASSSPIWPNTCSMEQLQSKAADPCINKILEDARNDVPFPHFVRCSRDRNGKPIMACCRPYFDRQKRPHQICEPIRTS